MHVSVPMMGAAVLATILPGPTGRAHATATPIPRGLGTLTISAPTSVNLGSAPLGGTVSKQLGAVTVDDGRFTTGTRTWTATVTSTNFTSAGRVITNANVKYWSGPLTAKTGPGTITPRQPTAASAVTLNTTQSAVVKTSGAGYNAATWNPTVVITIPATASAGTYSGVITQSVA